MNLNERIIYARESASLSQSDLAKKVGITPQAVQNWEYGKSSPRLPRLKEIAKVLGISEQWLITGGGTPKNTSTKQTRKIDNEIISLLEQLTKSEQKDALKILKQMAKKRQILNKYGIS